MRVGWEGLRLRWELFDLEVYVDVLLGGVWVTPMGHVPLVLVSCGGHRHLSIVEGPEVVFGGRSYMCLPLRHPLTMDVSLGLVGGCLWLSLSMYLRVGVLLCGCRVD